MGATTTYIHLDASTEACWVLKRVDNTTWLQLDDARTQVCIFGTDRQLRALVGAELDQFWPLFDAIEVLKPVAITVVLDALAESLGISVDAMAGAWSAFNKVKASEANDCD